MTVGTFISLIGRVVRLHGVEWHAFKSRYRELQLQSRVITLFRCVRSI